MEYPNGTGSVDEKSTLTPFCASHVADRVRSYRRVASRWPSFTGVSAIRFDASIAAPFGNSTITVLP